MQPPQNKQAGYILQLSEASFPSDKTKEFAESLIDQFNRNHRLSSKQWYYVRDMVEKYGRAMW